MSQTKPPCPQIGGKLENLAVPICATFNVESRFPFSPQKGMGDQTKPQIGGNLGNQAFPICATLSVESPSPPPPSLFPLERRGREDQTKPPCPVTGGNLGNLAFPICATFNVESPFPLPPSALPFPLGRADQAKPPRPQIGGKLGNLAFPICAHLPSPQKGREGKGRKGNPKRNRQQVETWEIPPLDSGLFMVTNFRSVNMADRPWQLWCESIQVVRKNVKTYYINKNETTVPPNKRRIRKFGVSNLCRSFSYLTANSMTHS